jgi:hypothetical protein
MLGGRIDPNMRLFHSNHSWNWKQVHSTGIKVSRVDSLPLGKIKILHWAPMFRESKVREVAHKVYNKYGNYSPQAFQEAYDLQLKFPNFSLEIDQLDWELYSERMANEN